MSDPRQLRGAFFNRRTAGPGLLAQSADWEIWTCEGPAFQHDYDQGVTLCVEQGQAVVEFDGGGRVDLQPGDAVSIAQGVRAVWTILQPIRNRYAFHGK